MSRRRSLERERRGSARPPSEREGAAVPRCDRFTLAPDKRAVREARLHVRAFTELPSETEANAELVVSELVANSVLHARLGPDDIIEVTLRCDSEHMSIEVADS